MGYPVLIALLARGKARALPTLSRLPSVSVIITAHNEEAIIADKLNNLLQLTYPPECLEIIVAGDQSTDRTNEIVRSYADRGVKLESISKSFEQHGNRGELHKAEEIGRVVLPADE